MNEEVRWRQRFQNYRKALGQLNSALAQYDEHAEVLIKEGILQRFEFTHELAWKVMKDYLEYEGHQGITGLDGQVWMDMIESPNRTLHTYDEKVLERVFSKVQKAYGPVLTQFAQSCRSIYNGIELAAYVLMLQRCKKGVRSALSK